jgi:phosphoenolpyruvate carboxylase
LSATSDCLIAWRLPQGAEERNVIDRRVHADALRLQPAKPVSTATTPDATAVVTTPASDRVSDVCVTRRSSNANTSAYVPARRERRLHVGSGRYESMCERSKMAAWSPTTTGRGRPISVFNLPRDGYATLGLFGHLVSDGRPGRALTLFFSW